MYSSTVTQFEEKREARENTEEDVEPIQIRKEQTEAKQPIIWRNVIGIVALHFLAIYGFVSGYRDAKFWTWIWCELYTD